VQQLIYLATGIDSSSEVLSAAGPSTEEKQSLGCTAEKKSNFRVIELLRMYFQVVKMRNLIYKHRCCYLCHFYFFTVDENQTALNTLAMPLTYSLIFG
jgi:hypothetical protein